jgi:hypothetical protein
MIFLECIAILLAGFGAWLLVSINKDLTKLREEAEKYTVLTDKAQNAHGRIAEPEQKRLRV